MRCQQQRRDRQSILMQGKENCHWRRSPTVPFPALVSVHVLLVRHQPCPTRCERQKMENDYTSTQEGPEVCGNGGRAAKTCTMRGQDGSQMFSLPSACTWCWRYFLMGVMWLSGHAVPSMLVLIFLRGFILLYVSTCVCLRVPQ